MKIQQVARPFDKSNNWLAEHARNVNSQNGEDGIIQEIFDIIGISLGLCVEFGAWDGKHLSNTHHLIQNHSWYGILIEANPEKFDELQETYKGNINANCINKAVRFESPDSLDDILSEAKTQEHIDLMSIDVDGADYHIWESMEKYRPRVVVIEFNPTIQNDILFIQDKNENVAHGCSLLALVILGKSKGYELICTTAWNAFFVPADLLPEFNIADNSIWAMHNDQPYRMCLFQLYDGTLTLAGMNKLLWHGVEIGHDEIQVLPKSIRKFDGKGE